MLNPFHDVNWKPGPGEKRRFAWSLVLGFPCLALGLFVLRRVATGDWDPRLPLIVGIVGVAVGVVLLLAPGIALPFYRAWYFLGCCLGFVTGNVLLTLFYFLCFTPVALLRRAFGSPALTKAPDPRANSYWKTAPPPPEPARYFRQF
jgi:hypothetical protein